MDKKKARLRRRFKARVQLRRLRKVRLCIHRSAKHIYAQVISADGSEVIAQASTLDKALKGELKSTGNIDAATRVGQLVAERAVEKGVKELAFDRSGFNFHGRVKALADAARKGGLEF